MKKSLSFQKIDVAQFRVPTSHFWAIAAFLVAQLIVGAHAYADADESQSHDFTTCQFCHIADRDSDLLAPDAAILSAPIEALSGIDAAQSRFVFEDRIFTVNSRAPPTI